VLSHSLIWEITRSKRLLVERWPVCVVSTVSRERVISSATLTVKIHSSDSPQQQRREQPEAGREHACAQRQHWQPWQP
jgi:hypothetical protein